ncbi:hypothetical protein Tco_0309117 [Tanacetum coccineum]
MNVVYVLTTQIPDDGDDATVEQIKKKSKLENDDYVCHGIIPNGMSDSLFDIYQNVESGKELWDSLEAKYMVEDASRKKFCVSDFTNYKMTDSRRVMEQYNELLRILGRFAQHKMNMEDAIQVFCIIDKLLPSWKEFKHTLKHKKEDLTLVELGSHLRIKEYFRVKDSDKPKGNNVVGPSVVNMEEHKNSTRMMMLRGGLTQEQQFMCVKISTNIVLQGLPPDVYAIVNHHKVAKKIWNRVKLLMQGMELSLQEKECKLYDEFHKFSFVKGETLYQYYWIFAQLINNINVINMSMRPVQVNTKFLNSLPPKWSKFVTDVKLARDLHTTNYDQLYSYLEQHEAYANETRLMRER